MNKPAASIYPQLPLTQMLSSAHDTISISSWLMRWIQPGDRYPEVVVCDGSRAIFNALSLAFCGYQNIETYANSVFKNLLDDKFDEKTAI